MTRAEMYINLCALTRRSHNLDHSYRAAFYLLSTDPEIYQHASRYVSVDGISFRGMKLGGKHLHEQQRKVVEIAHNLFSWTERCPVTPYDISQLGLPALEAAINAIHIAACHADVHINEVDGQKWLSLSWDRYRQTASIYAQISSMSMAADESEYDMER